MSELTRPRAVALPAIAAAVERDQSRPEIGCKLIFEMTSFKAEALPTLQDLKRRGICTDYVDLALKDFAVPVANLVQPPTRRPWAVADGACPRDEGQALWARANDPGQLLSPGLRAAFQRLR